MQVSGTADEEAGAPGGSGAFVRAKSEARKWIGSAEYPAEAGRYHLYVAFNCPWCHRVVLARSILQVSITMDVAFPTRTSEKDAKGRDGLWTFRPEGMRVPNGDYLSFPECTAETVFSGVSTVAEIYDMFDIPQKSLPLLVDKHTKTIVSNESAEILRMFSTYSRELGGADLDLYPEPLRPTIDEVNTWVYHEINNGSYKAGFSSSQTHYEEAYGAYFAALAKCDALLATHTFLVADTLTEADIRLFPTLFRHDPVYYSRFKLNHAFLHAYPNLLRWMRTMFRDVPGVKASSDASYLQHCKQGYFGRTGSNTIPVGPPNYPDCYY
eukprot:CAMPEP_0197392382 /NCGR_PEP_ID=MMETSP1165-20131217/3688_1 /TAXON_ID=284809 /ORGANISM="Chrysocystis fragilis, Strain CCMP3189" /LENGTH=324 /DNA_ID=CAMNT_0042918005 /DNA_START=55 /DNA_END=1029 /DNA_ORIENTATION=+